LVSTAEYLLHHINTFCGTIKPPTFSANLVLKSGYLLHL
jgi:hypothetical protein